MEAYLRRKGERHISGRSRVASGVPGYPLLTSVNPAAAASPEWACKVMSPPLVHTDRTRSRSMWVRAIVCEDPVVLWLPDRRYMPLSMPRAVAINTGIDTMSLVPWAGPISVQRPSLSPCHTQSLSSASSTNTPLPPPHIASAIRRV